MSSERQHPSTGSSATISGHPNPDLNGVVEFRFPSVYESIRIEARASELVAPMRFEDVSPDGRGLARLIATLEFVIVKAPKGFYRDTPTGPALEPGRLATSEQAMMWRLYSAYVQARDTFRTDRKSVAVEVTGEPSGESDMARSEAPEPQSPIEFGNPQPGG